MKKQITTAFLLLATTFAFSQVGIQTVTPQATLDVVGAPTDATKQDGIIAPRITGAQLRAKTYTADQTGALVYVTLADTAPAGQTTNVTIQGYYYFDGTLWQVVKTVQDLRLVGNFNHITQDAGTGSTGTSAGSGSRNVFIGNIAGNAITTGNNNVGIGGSALSSVSGGNSNTALGVNALQANTVDGSTAIGYQALEANTTGAANTAIGARALTLNVTGQSNVALGSNALNRNLGSFNTALGTGALGANTTGNENTAVGASLIANTTGTYNTAVGRLTLASVTTGQFNSAVGRTALQQSRGSGNTAFGEGAGAVLAGAVLTADNNTLIGRGEPDI